MREFNTDTIRIISAFENITGTEVRDCIRNDFIFFLVNEGKVAIAIGKNGQNIKNAEKMMRKQIKVFEWSNEPKTFIKNLFSPIFSIRYIINLLNFFYFKLNNN